MNSALISFAILFATLVGWGVGSLISDKGYGLSLMTPGNAIFASIYFNQFNAIWMILGSQLIGAIIGWALYLVVSYVNKEKAIQIDELINTDIDIARYAVKELLFQFLLGILILASIPLQQSITAYGTSKLITQLVVAMSVFVLLVVSGKSGYFMFSPFLVLPVLVHSFVTKQAKLEHLYRFGISIVMYTSLFIGIGYGGYAFEKANGRG